MEKGVECEEIPEGNDYNRMADMVLKLVRSLSSCSEMLGHNIHVKYQCISQAAIWGVVIYKLQVLMCFMGPFALPVIGDTAEGAAKMT